MTETSPAEDSVLTLSDGRRLGFAQYGRPGGEPIMYFHGHPGSRLEARLAHEPAAASGFRVIAPDRPGYGQSDFLPGRAITDWPADVAEVADALGIDNFSVAGASGGGPYARAPGDCPKEFSGLRSSAASGRFRPPAARWGCAGRTESASGWVRAGRAWRGP